MLILFRHDGGTSRTSGPTGQMKVISMPPSPFKPSESHPQPQGGTESDHYFDVAHGDVAALHARIERGFAQYHFERAPRSSFDEHVEDSIHLLSRLSGVLGLAVTLGIIAYILI
ncbi:MAG: hypothetical protein QM690_06930 [Sphingobium sp.]